MVWIGVVWFGVAERHMYIVHTYLCRGGGELMVASELGRLVSIFHESGE